MQACEARTWSCPKNFLITFRSLTSHKKVCFSRPQEAKRALSCELGGESKAPSSDPRQRAMQRPCAAVAATDMATSLISWLWAPS